MYSPFNYLWICQEETINSLLLSIIDTTVRSGSPTPVLLPSFTIGSTVEEQNKCTIYNCVKRETGERKEKKKSKQSEISDTCHNWNSFLKNFDSWSQEFLGSRDFDNPSLL